MNITKKNIDTIDIDEKTREMLRADLEDIYGINAKSGKRFFISRQDFHDEYSPERTDPCPDYYGYFTIREWSRPYEVIGPQCATEDELEDVIMTISNTIDALDNGNQSYYECGKGWHPLIEEAKKIVAEYNDTLPPDEEPVRFTQIKEKWGGLCLYLNFAPREIWDKIEEIEDRSRLICEECGATEGVETKETRGWVWTLCPKCREKKDKEFYEFFKKANGED